jgi:putative transposase
MVTPVVERQAMAHLCQSFEVSQRRACQVIEADRSSMRYHSVRPDDAALRARLRELSAVRRRFGYRRLLLLLRREGALVNHKKCGGSTGRNVSRSAVVAVVKGLWEQGLR